ncbi:MAG: iron-sulfur cluster co-chaperone HscB C-terminal domain-containing protein [Methylophilaceae bacterium]
MELAGINAIAETNTSMPAYFLMQQMEWREQLEDFKAKKNSANLENLLDEMRSEAKTLQADLANLFDQKHDLPAAAEATRKLIFIDKVCDDIHKAILSIEN